MAWKCSATSNAGLVANMQKAGLIRTDRLARAMSATDRKHYVPLEPNYRTESWPWPVPYEDAPQSIEYGATISAPHMHAHALEALMPFLEEGNRVLDVGHGSGYLLAVLHRLLGPRARVVGIEHIAPLVARSRANLAADGIAVVEGDGEMQREEGGVRIVCGDGRMGYPPDAPYDAIHVGAAAPTIPEPLVDQLNAPGRMFIPVGTDVEQHYIWQVDKHADGSVTREKLYAVRYVPLTDADKQWRERG